MNELLTTQPIVILTGAGASKALGKATTFDIYDSPEFQKRAKEGPLAQLSRLRTFLKQESSKPPIDLEVLLDRARELNDQFDDLKATPPYSGRLGQGEEVRNQLVEAYEQTLDFMVEYYGSIDRQMAAELYRPFLDGLVSILKSNWRKHLPITMFTLNYDAAVESAVEELASYELVDGFSNAYTPLWDADVFERVAPKPDAPVPVVLFKVHGSVSWTRPGGTDRIERTIFAPRQREGRPHVLLYPTSRGKNIGEEPFATAYKYLEDALLNCRMAVFIGTSFRDKELTDRIKHRLDQRGPFTLVAVSPDANSTQIAERIGYPEEHIVPVRMSFQEGQMDQLLDHISERLKNAPAPGGEPN